MPEGVWWKVRNVQSREGGEMQKPNLLTSQFYLGSALPSFKTGRSRLINFRDLLILLGNHSLCGAWDASMCCSWAKAELLREACAHT